MAVVEEGAFSQAGEATITPSGVRLSYGLPSLAQARTALPAEWNRVATPKLHVAIEPGIHRIILGDEVGGDGKVYYCVATRYELVWQVPARVDKIAIEPGQPLTLQNYNPVQQGIKWRIERKSGGTNFYATFYSLAIRYALNGVPSNRVVPLEVDKLKGLKLYYQQ